MPQAIPLIAQGILYAAGASTLVQAAVLITASLVVAKYQADKAKKKARRDFEASLRDNMAVIRSAVAERNTVYGRRMVSGPLVLFETGGDLQQYLYMAVALADHECDGFEEIYLNDQPIGPLDGDGYPQGGMFYKATTERPQGNSRSVQPSPGLVFNLDGEPHSNAISVVATYNADEGMFLTNGTDYIVQGSQLIFQDTENIRHLATVGRTVALNYRYTKIVKYVRAFVHLGKPGQAANPMLVNELGGTKWNSQFRGEGVTYVVVRLQLNTDVFPNGPPNIKVLLRGKKVYDPRKNLVPNFSFSGAQAGSPGVAPPGLSWTSAGSNGITRQIVGRGEENGLPYVDIRYYGTAVTSTSYNVYFNAGAASAAIGSSWRGRAYIKRIAGNLSSASPSLRLGTFTGTSQVQVAAIGITDNGTLANHEVSVTATSAHDNIRLYLRWSATSGVPMDLTLRVAAPMLFSDSQFTDPLQWSQNPVLQLRDYLKQLEVAEDEIDYNSFIAEANVCDESVNIGGSAPIEPRYRCDADLSSGDTPMANMSVMTSSMNGTCMLSGGAWRVYAARYRTPVMTITDDDLVDSQPVVIQPRAPRDQLFNGVRGKYIEPGKYWQTVDFPPVLSSVYRQEDGVELVQDVEYPGVTSAWQAQRLAKMTLHQARQSMTVTASYWWRVLPLQPGDFVRRSSARYGWVDKVFSVVETKLSLTEGVSLTLQEEAAQAYEWSYLEAIGVDPAPNTNLPSAFFVLPPTGLTLSSGDLDMVLNSDGTVISRIKVSWNQSTDANVLNGGVVQVQYKAVDQTDWEIAPNRPGDDTVAYTGAVRDGMTYEVRVRFVNGLGVASQWTNSGFHTVLGRQQKPSDVPGVTCQLESFGIRIVIQQTPDKDVRAYEIREGGTSWATASVVTRIAATPVSAATEPVKYLHQQLNAGVRTIRVKAIDSLGQESVNDTSASITILAPTVSNIGSQFKGQNIELDWVASPGSFPIVRYRISYGPTAPGTFIADALTTRYNTKVDFGGTRRYWVTAVDQYGNTSTAQFEDVTVLIPNTVDITAEVLDNNIILRFTDATTTLPIERYEISKGASYATSVLVGDNGNGRFAMFFEQAQGTYTYWVRAVDTAGNVSVVASTSAYMGQPPDYVLQSDLNLTFDNTFTYSNAAQVGGLMVAPVSTAETWATHFTGNSWTTPDAQVAAGFPVYAQPNVASGYAEYIVDYGAVLASTSCTTTLSYTNIGTANCTVTYQISFKTAAADPWQDAPAGPSAYLINFRYVKVRVNITRPGANRTSLIQASKLNIKLAVKLLTDNGTGTANAADANGTTVFFNRQFVYVSGPPVVQPSGTTPIIPVVEFDGSVPYPTSFKVRLFNKDGVRVSGDFSWTARGA